VDRFYGWSGPSVNRTWTWVDANALNLEGFIGTIGNAIDHWVTGSTLRRRDLRTVLIKFAAADSTWDPAARPADTNFSRAYRYLRGASAAPSRPEFARWIINKEEGCAYQDHNWGVPFSAWNMEAIPHIRLAVGHLENNVAAGRVDGRYWPPVDGVGLDNVVSDGPQEWFFIFAAPYSESPDSALTKNLAYAAVPMMWFGTPNRQAGMNFHSGEDFLIEVTHPPHAGDRWSFNPLKLFPEAKQYVPQAFGLAPNYPNPFNPGTTIRFFLPAPSNVALRIYDLLGREVDVAFEGPVAAGTHEVQWNARNLASGVYFYRLEATPQDGRGGKITQTKKMLFLQ
ncbi:MAG TPA: T9SS type A sorting domain-containing protein, partial [Bacteroidota bacterium]